MSFERSVFINCPFDPAYLPILRPILFCVIDLGLEPRIALERLNSGEPRIEKIIELIRQTKYGIHDLSRIKAGAKGELYRLNMPFELGLDIGSRVFGARDFPGKRCLILETERYRYQAAISDLSNSDIAVHGDDPFAAMAEVRNWLVSAAGLRPSGPAAIWGRFNDFVADNYAALKARGYSDRDIENLPIPELIEGVRAWCSAYPPRHAP